MTDDAQEDDVQEQAALLNDVAVDERVQGILGGLRERIGQEVAQAVTDLQEIGLADDAINTLVEMELILVSKFERVHEEAVVAEFRE